MKKNINIIVAYQQSDYGIAQNGKIPWYSPTDMKYFKQITTTTTNSAFKNAVIMGRKTFESIGHPLSDRINYVISSKSTEKNDALIFVQDIHKALEMADNNPNVDQVFIIGGESIYKYILNQDWYNYINNIYITVVTPVTAYNCDAYFPFEKIKKNLTLINTTKNNCDNLSLDFQVWRMRNVEEEQYLNLLKKILETGDSRNDRTQIGTISLFGEKMTFSLDRIPIITTRKMAWKTVIRELLWFISGDTNVKNLQAKNVHIWDKNTTRAFLDAQGLTDLPEGDMGAGYGYQWRHFGADYRDCMTDYIGKGYDQLKEVIRLILHDPNSRRILISAWNPMLLHRMALPPCHVLAQFYVSHGYLDCQVYQRSGDMVLGVPFNIASYALLTCMIAHVTHLRPRRLLHILGDAHIYKNHIQQTEEQLKRTPYLFPRLQFTRKVNDIDDFKETDFELINYECHKELKLDMAI